MIIAFSTSSPTASVAFISQQGMVLWCGDKFAPQAASGACMEMLEEGLLALDSHLADASLFAADIGPGSFTGVRVAVTLAKTFASVHGVPAAGASSFDLIAPAQTVVLPSKRGEFFVRRPGEEPERTTTLPEEGFVGYGFGGEEKWPHAKQFSLLLDDLVAADPIFLVPEYLIEPSISLPKKPYGFGGLGA